jgi:hypothetical protein
LVIVFCKYKAQQVSFFLLFAHIRLINWTYRGGQWSRGYSWANSIRARVPLNVYIMGMSQYQKDQGESTRWLGSEQKHFLYIASSLWSSISWYRACFITYFFAPSTSFTTPITCSNTAFGAATTPLFSFNVLPIPKSSSFPHASVTLPPASCTITTPAA